MAKRFPKPTSKRTYVGNVRAHMVFTIKKIGQILTFNEDHPDMLLLSPEQATALGDQAIILSQRVQHAGLPRYYPN